MNLKDAIEKGDAWRGFATGCSDGPGQQMPMGPEVYDVLRAAAARYLWLRESGDASIFVVGPIDRDIDGAELDRMIDERIP